MRVTSEMAAYTSSGGAAMSREISSLLVMVQVHYTSPGAVERGMRLIPGDRGQAS